MHNLLAWLISWWRSVASIMSLPKAAGFPKFALSLALSDVGFEQAAQSLAVAESDARTHLLPAEFSNEEMTLQ